jgi:hypothetical protein
MEVLIKVKSKLIFLLSMVISVESYSKTLDLLGADTDKASVIKIPSKGISQKGPVTLIADKIVIAGEILTNGYALNISSRVLEFKGSGLIRTFSKSAVPVLYVDNRLDKIQGNPSAPFPMNFVGQTGAIGISGNPGNQNPGAITIVASKLLGTIRINASGQNGGKGGKGGSGGQGVIGKDGVDAICKTSKSGNTEIPGTDGSHGGAGGLGGFGGRGGNGGPNAKVFITLGNSGLQTRTFSQDTFKEGQVELVLVPGNKGPVGELGHTGRNGSAGRGGIECHESEKVALFGRTYADAAGGKDGTYWENKNTRSRPQNGKHGVLRKKSIELKTYFRENKLKESVLTMLYQYHWNRLLHILFQDGIRLIDIKIKTRKILLMRLSSITQSLFNNSHEEYFNQLMEKWNHSFIHPIEEKIKNWYPGSLNKVFYTNILNEAKNFLDIIDLIKTDHDPLDIQKRIQSFLKKGNKSLRRRIKSINQSCYILNERIQELRNIQASSLLSIPVCQKEKLIALIKNPFAPFRIRHKVSIQKLGPYSGKITQSSYNSRMICSYDNFDTIFLNNNKYTTEDFLVITKGIQNDISNKIVVNKLLAWDENDVTEENYEALLKSLVKGVK